MQDKYLDNIASKLPDICNTKDLVRIGLYANSAAASNARRRGKCPPFFKLPQRGVVYMREAVIDFIIESQKKKSCKLSEVPREGKGLISLSKEVCLKAHQDRLDVEKSDSYTDAV